MWCVNVGYGRPEIADIAHRQMTELNFLALVMSSEPVVAFADKIQEMLGFDAHVYLSSSGSEANEPAMKIAR